MERLADGGPVVSAAVPLLFSGRAHTCARGGRLSRRTGALASSTGALTEMYLHWRPGRDQCPVVQHYIVFRCMAPPQNWPQLTRCVLPKLPLCNLAQGVQYGNASVDLPDAGCEGRRDPQQGVARLTALRPFSLASRRVPRGSEVIPSRARHHEP